MIAYDYETTSIPNAEKLKRGEVSGTPRPLYITAYGHDFEYGRNDGHIENMAHLNKILVNNFLTEENDGCKFVAWNGNNFDAYFTAASLVHDERYILRPYLTRSNALRGLRVSLSSFADKRGGPSWEFVDGIAMLGLVATPLHAFLDKFAPNFRKLKEAIDFESGEEFDGSNPIHRAYAFRDSEGLYHGMQRAQEILLEKFNQPLAVTMGGACIKIFKANIPPQVTVYSPPPEVTDLIRDYVMRGGFCYCVKRFKGKIWKYDINQAYASAMRESKLPHGNLMHSSNGVHPFASIYIARVTAHHAANRVPFYYRSERNGKMRSLFATTDIYDTWLTSTEISQLNNEGWQITIHESYTWDSHFTMADYVNKLESGRSSADGGPNGPIGTMFKNVGNHSYGKTVEQLEPTEFVLAKECPDGYAPYYSEENAPLEHVYFRFKEDSRAKDYHQPQIGAFITAHVRMVVRRAALLAPDAWLYADTDCVVFSRDITRSLDIDPKRYGAWKIEESGTEYQIIAKKVYAEIGDPEAPKEQLQKLSRSAKGLNVKRLTPSDFTDWYEGHPPVQDQVQRQNFLSVIRGAEMYRPQERSGTRVNLHEK